MVTNEKGLPKTAVIGCGYWGKNLVRNFAELGALAAVCDANTEAAQKVADKYCVSVLSLDEVLECEAIAGVVIAAPAEMHYELGRRCLKSGKHVYVEKPLSLFTAEAEELCRLATRVGKTLMVGHLLQYHPGFLKLKQMVAEQKLGKLQYLYSNRLNLGKIRREENILWSFAPHDISMILSLLDEEPISITATGSAYLHEVIADVTTTYLIFPSGVHAHVFVSWLHPFKEQKLVVVGSEGMAVFDDGRPWDSKVLHYRHKIAWVDGTPVPFKAEPIAISIEAAEPLRLECAHFLECVASGKRPRTDGEEGLRVLRVLEAAQNALDGNHMP